MSTEGVDYLGTGPTPDQLVAAGKHFRLGYLDRPDSSLTRADIDALHAHGLDVGFFAEWGSQMMLHGASGGSTDGARAKAAMAALGAPTTCVIYFAADWDVQRTQYATVEAYMTAAKSAAQPYVAGLYGGLDIVSHVKAAGIVGFFCQTYAWSAGIWASGIQLQQYSNGQIIGGHAVDLERAMVADWGQWKAGSDVPYLAPTTQDYTMLVDVASGGSVYWDLQSSQVAIPVWAGAKGVITLGTGTRADGKVMRAIELQTTVGGPTYIAWVGVDKCSNVRPKTPPAIQSVTVTGSGIKVVGP